MASKEEEGESTIMRNSNHQDGTQKEKITTNGGFWLICGLKPVTEQSCLELIQDKHYFRG